MEEGILADNKWHGDLELERLVRGTFFINKFLVLSQLSLLKGNENFIVCERRKMQKVIFRNLIDAYSCRGMKGALVALLTCLPYKLWGIFAIWRTEKDITSVLTFLKSKVTSYIG